MVVLIKKGQIGFPDPRKGENIGLFAVGGDLSPEMIKLGYMNGIFPWTPFNPDDNEFVDEDGKSMNLWYCPMFRFVIYSDKIHISHSMRQLMNSGKYKVTHNLDFDDVIYNCGHVNNRIKEEGAWLGPEVIKVYTELHKQGVVESFEVWNQDNMLVGGLYGSRVKDCFIGESMFSIEPNTSKLALIALSQWLLETKKKRSISFIDCQMPTSHLKSMGGTIIPYMNYLRTINPQSYKLLNELDEMESAEFMEESQDGQ